MMYGKCAIGSELPQSKLDEKLVRMIRKMHQWKESEKQRLDAEYSASAMAKKLGVHQRTIEKALRYETWRHVHD